MNDVALKDVSVREVAKSRMHYIDAARGAACLAVVCFHTSFAFVAQQAGHGTVFRSAAAVIERGWLGVSLFLVLSGFCLYYPLARKKPISEIRLTTKSFFQRRALRILPAYYITLVVFMVISYKNQHHTEGFSTTFFINNIVLHFLMLHNLVPSTVLTINPAFWSLGLETQLYFLFPILVLIAARFGLRGILISTFALSVAWQIFCHFRLAQFGDLNTDDTLNLNMVFYYALPARCFEFAAGMAAAALVAQGNSKKIRQIGWLGLLFCVPAFIFSFLGMRFGLFMDQIWGIVFACGLAALSLIPESIFEKGIPRMFTWLGVFSYSTYLVHQPILWWLHKDTRGGRASFMATDLFAAVIFLLEIVIAIGAGYLFFICVERPFIRMGQRWVAGRLGSSTKIMPSPAP